MQGVSDAQTDLTNLLPRFGITENNLIDYGERAKFSDSMRARQVRSVLF